LADKIEETEKIPVDDLTLEQEEFEVIEEINPIEMKFEK
jgi:hypothetical protein